MANEPLVFQHTYCSTEEEDVSKEVMKKVAELYGNYPKIRVIVHEPLVLPYPNSSPDIVFMTTIIATKDDVHIDIGFNSPT